MFDDRNGNGSRDDGEPGVAGVAVSNGREVVRSDRRGRYSLPVAADTILFVVKPRDWMTPLDADGLPRFFYIHKPEGSPEHLFFPGVAPTGPLPSSVDFPLLGRPEPEAFRAIVLADPQPANLEQVDFLGRDVVAELVGTDAAFGMTLGDIVDNDLRLFEAVNGALGRIGIPWYNVLGNHDMNFRSRGDAHSDETFERVYGPATYAFQWGPVHFIVLDDVRYRGATPGGSPGPYEGSIGDDQLGFVRNYLAFVPPQELVVLAMHIPLADPAGAPLEGHRRLLELLSAHPYTLSLSGHRHIQYHAYFGSDEGYAPGEHHHWNVAAASGSWWRGTPDEVGIPHATMSCGSPNGYGIIDFEGHRYRLRFKAARRPANHQLEVFLPGAPGAIGELPASEAEGSEVLVNVFAGSDRWRVEMRLSADGPWIPLAREERVDPAYAAARKRERQLSPRLPEPAPSPHLWAGTLPAVTSPGTALLEVRATSPDGAELRGARAIRFR